MKSKEQENWLRDFVQKSFGIVLSEEKAFSVAAQMHVEVFKSGFANLPEYLTNHADSANHLIDLINSITINFSYFYRGEEQMLFVREVLAPEWLETIHAQGNKDADLRVWSAGCATGEEPYSVAMILDNFIGLGLHDLRVKLLGTDISRIALADAQEGIYRSEAVKDLPISLKERYFRDVGEKRVQVIDRLKEAILFRSLNLVTESYPFKNQFNLILCRNVMIYFDEATNSKVLQSMVRVLAPGGYLFLGPSDPHPKADFGLKCVESGIFKKVA